MVEYNNSADVGSIVDEAVKYCGGKEGRRLALIGNNLTIEEKIRKEYKRRTGEIPVRCNECEVGSNEFYTINLNEIEKYI